ncbi:AMP-binding protein [Flagellimonas flava]|uniref:O-succinylbenzoic acid--CoA ligase n=1 Tax=Flagellimonas flava TaxID=570519 RepID=A0A1M5J2C2_9FLAO|nr:AMP-binding protein [Allomuricauda flava]SHG34495.1 O-succinylbenzoic acid--CoA ligase [Allomuricauda flava]
MMVNPSWRKLHPDFKLNGKSYQWEELPEVGYSLIKEGEPFERAIGDFLVDWTMDNPTVLVQTSGSTGKPKDILLKKEHMVNSAKATGNYFGLQAGDTSLLCLPSTGIAGKMMLVRAMVLGLELDYVKPSSTPLDNISRNYDFCAMVPLQVEHSLLKLECIRTLIIGGASVSPSLKERLMSLPAQVFETYGMTETITHVAVKSVKNSGFKALPNISFAQDDRGCLVIEASKISDEPVVTNDMVELISETEFQWLGRYDSIINSGGVKLIPEQIEQKIAPLISSRFFVAGIPDEVLGEKLVLILEGEAVPDSDFLDAIKRLDGINKYEVPKELYFVPTFEMTTTEKVNRNVILRNLFG